MNPAPHTSIRVKSSSGGVQMDQETHLWLRLAIEVAPIVVSSLELARRAVAEDEQ